MVIFAPWACGATVKVSTPFTAHLLQRPKRADDPQRPHALVLHHQHHPARARPTGHRPSARTSNRRRADRAAGARHRRNRCAPSSTSGRSGAERARPRSGVAAISASAWIRKAAGRRGRDLGLGRARRANERRQRRAAMTGAWMSPRIRTTRFKRVFERSFKRLRH